MCVVVKPINSIFMEEKKVREKVMITEQFPRNALNNKKKKMKWDYEIESNW